MDKSQKQKFTSTLMTSTKSKFVWDKSMRQAYDKFKDSFSEQVLLQPFDPNKKALIYIDKLRKQP